MLTPAVVFFFIFSYIPMFGVIMAFKYFQYDKGILFSPWVGLKNFAFFFHSGEALLLTKNTILYNVAFIFTNIVFQVGIAILFSEIKGKLFKKTAHSIMFLPYFISWVIVGSFVYSIFNFEFGSMNTLLKSLKLQPVDFYGTPGIWKYIIVGFNLWKYTGYGSIIYLAAITGINPELYEAADLDGATIFHKIRYITVPMITNTVMIMLLLSIGGILRGNMDLFYQIIGNNAMLFNSTDVIDTFVFRALRQANDMGLAAAVGLFQQAVGFVLIMCVNTIVKKVNPDYSLF